ncbi:MAG: hypothetical protein K2K72_06195, partial [Duncaniella sp.]|nr:hypothetical protein [Duncaniella sp.]
TKLVGFYTPLPGAPVIGPGTDPDPVNPDPVNPDPVLSGSVIVDFLGKVPSQSFVTVTGNYATNKGVATYGDKTYNTCVKLESSTNISVALGDKKYKMTLVFADAETGNIKIDGTKTTSTGSTIVVAEATGTVVLTKADTRNLFLIVLEEISQEDSRLPIVISPEVTE